MIVLSNLSDAHLSELLTAIYTEQRRRFLNPPPVLRDDPLRHGVERMRYIREVNPGISLLQAKWYVEYLTMGY